MTKVLAIAAVGEALIGAVLLVDPPTVVRLLFGAGIAGARVAISRIAGIGLFALGLACWPGGADRALSGMLTYSLLATLYLAYLGLAGKWAGILLWPAIVVHAGLTGILTSGWISKRR